MNIAVARKRSAPPVAVSNGPATTVQATTPTEIQQVLADWKRYPGPVRPVGSGSSTTRCVTANGGTQLDLSSMNRVLKIDGDTVTVQPGISLPDLAEVLADEGLELVGGFDLANRTVGGAVCAAGLEASMAGDVGQFASHVVQLKVLSPNGKKFVVTEKTKSLLALMRLSYGLLGVVYEVTLRGANGPQLFYVDERARVVMADGCPSPNVFAAGEIIRLVWKWSELTWLFGGPKGIKLIPPFPDIPVLSIDFYDPANYYYLCLVVVTVSLVILYRIEHSRIGLTFHAIHWQDKLAESVGVNTFRYRMLAFVVSAFFAGLEYLQRILLEDLGGYRLLRAAGEDFLPPTGPTFFRPWLLLLLPAVGAGLIWAPVAIYFLLTGATIKGVVLIAFGVLVLFGMNAALPAMEEAFQIGARAAFGDDRFPRSRSRYPGVHGQGERETARRHAVGAADRHAHVQHWLTELL